MSENSKSQQQKKPSKAKTLRKGIAKLVKSPKRSHPVTIHDGNTQDGIQYTSGDHRSATLAHGSRQRIHHDQAGLQRSRSLNELAKDDDSESLNSAATINVFRSVHFDSTHHLAEGMGRDSGWAMSSSHGDGRQHNTQVGPQIVVHDPDHMNVQGRNNGPSQNGVTSYSPNTAVPGRSSLKYSGASMERVSNVGNNRSATLPRNTKLRSMSDGDDDKKVSSSSTPRDLDNLGVIKLVASNPNLTNIPASPPPPSPVHSPPHESVSVQGITHMQLREVEERNERKIRRTVDKILKRQRESGVPSISASNQKLTVWECMVLEIQRSMETLYIEKTQKERHLIRSEIITKLEAEKKPTRPIGTQVNLTVVEARPFIKPPEVHHTDFESQTKDLDEIETIALLKAKLRNLQENYNTLRSQYDDKLIDIERMRSDFDREINELRKKLKAQPMLTNSVMQHSPAVRSDGFQTTKRSTSNLVTFIDEIRSYNTGTQTNELAELELIHDLKTRLANIESERHHLDDLYEEKVTEFNTTTLEYQQRVLYLESKQKPDVQMVNAKIQVSPDVYDAGIQASPRTSDLWTYTNPGKEYKDSSDLQIQVDPVTRDQICSPVTPATRNLSSSPLLSMHEIEQRESLYRSEREQSDVTTTTVRAASPELPDNSLILKYLETSGNRSDDMITAVGVLLNSDEAHTTSLESVRYMDVEATTNHTPSGIVSSAGGYYSLGSDGISETNRSVPSLIKANNYGSSREGYLAERVDPFSIGSKGYSTSQYVHTSSGNYLSDIENSFNKSTKITSTPQSYEYSVDTSSNSNGKHTAKPTSRFFKYGMTDQQHQPGINLSRKYVPEP